MRRADRPRQLNTPGDFARHRYPDQFDDIIIYDLVEHLGLKKGLKILQACAEARNQDPSKYTDGFACNSGMVKPGKELEYRRTEHLERYVRRNYCTLPVAIDFVVGCGNYLDKLLSFGDFRLVSPKNEPPTREKIEFYIRTDSFWVCYQLAFYNDRKEKDVLICNINHLLRMGEHKKYPLPGYANETISEAAHAYTWRKIVGTASKEWARSAEVELMHSDLYYDELRVEWRRCREMNRHISTTADLVTLYSDVD